MSAGIVALLKQAHAALSQNATFPADVALAKRAITEATANVEALAEALYLALPYVTDAEGFPEQFKPGAVAKDVARVRAAIAAYEGGV